MELIFKEENRVINRGHVEAIKKSIKKHGFIKGHPILVSPNGEIIDGQHRYIACKELGIEPEFITVDCKHKSSIIDLNIAQKSWMLADFVNYYATEGNRSYQILQELMNETKLGATLCLILLGGEQTLVHTSFTELKKGELHIEIEENTYKNALVKYENLVRIAKLLKLIKPNKNMTLAYDRLLDIEGFDADYLVHKCKRHQGSLYLCGTVSGYFQMFLKVYNSHKKGNEILIGG